MSGWARSDRSGYRAPSPSPLDDLRCHTQTKASTSTSKRLEKGINLLEEALAKCDTDDAYKSTLELYASHVQTQRQDIAALRAELERAKKPAIDYRSKINALQSNLVEKEGEFAELRSQVKKLESLVKSKNESLDACCSQLSEERQWRKAAIECLQNELSLSKETAGLISSIQEKKKKITPAATTGKNLFSKRMNASDLTQRNLGLRSREENRNLQFASENTEGQGTEDNDSDIGSGNGDHGDKTAAEEATGNDKEWSLDITAVSAVLSR